MTVRATPVAGAFPGGGAPALRDDEFLRVASLLKGVAGIDLKRGKEGLVRARLARRLRQLRLDGFGAYLTHLESDRTRAELGLMVDALTTNKTSFFREPQHFDYLRRVVLPELRASGSAPCFWSAGCSTGEEPYTLAMVLRDALPAAEAARCRILATDISSRVLARAREGRYPAELLGELPADTLRRHFARGDGDGWTVAEPLRRMVRFARLNLMGEWPMRGPFDAILCRNVMIYFDKSTQGELVERFWELLAPGGHLLVGHSESLTGLPHRFRYVQPAVYVK